MKKHTSELKTALLFGFFCLLGSINTYGQETKPTVATDTLYRVETNDGNVFIGKLVVINNERIVLESGTLGQISLSRKYVVKIEAIIDDEDLGISGGWYRNLQSARYFFSPNGYGLDKGESYYQNIWILYNQYSVGISKHFSIGVGLIPLFLFAGTPTPVWIAPKFSIPIVKDKVNLGAGALIGTVIGEGGGSFGITFATATFGPRDKNASLGIGYVFANGEIASVPLINIGGLSRVSKNTYLMTENYIVFNEGSAAGVIIVGARSMINRSAIDYGLGIPFAPDMGTFFALPWLGLTVPFHKLY